MQPSLSPQSSVAEVLAFWTRCNWCSLFGPDATRRAAAVTHALILTAAVPCALFVARCATITRRALLNEGEVPSVSQQPSCAMQPSLPPQPSETA
eukprot:1400763-Pleurochrysis_carterae.AAC.2